MNLLYSQQDDVLVNRNQIALMSTPEPMGRFHSPYPFAQYIDDVDLALKNTGLRIVDEEYAVTKDHNRMFGLMEIAPLEGDLIQSKDWTITVGLRGSHDQRIPRGMVLGTSVLVCSNLCFHGNIANFATKQTINIAARLPELIREAVTHIPQMAEKQETVFNRYKVAQFQPNYGDQMLVELYRQGAFASPQLTTAIDEWHAPSYERHTEHDRDDGKWSAWRLFNACTEALKPTGNTTNMVTIEQRSRKVSDYLNDCVAIAA